MTLLLLIAAVFSACTFYPDPGKEEGGIVITMPDADSSRISRFVVFTSEEIDRMRYTITCTGPGGTKTFNAGSGETITASLLAGRWYIELAAFSTDGSRVGTGSSYVEVTAGELSLVDIPITAHMASQYRGTYDGFIIKGEVGLDKFNPDEDEFKDKGTVTIGNIFISDDTTTISYVNTSPDNPITKLGGIVSNGTWAYLYKGSEKIGIVFQSDYILGLGGTPTIFLLGQKFTDLMLPQYIDDLGISGVVTSDMSNIYSGGGRIYKK
jgi:hypothetical protein